MKKLTLILAVGFFSILFSSTVNAQMPQVFAAGFIESTDDPALMIHYNAIESNQPVYEWYDVELVVDYYHDGIYDGRYDFVGINFVEIPVGAPSVSYSLYEQDSWYILRPANPCGGLVDRFGFSICYGANYFFPFTFEGTCAPVCVAIAGVVLGAFQLAKRNLPTVTLEDGANQNNMFFRPNQINRGGTSTFTFRIRTRSDLPGTPKCKVAFAETNTAGLGGAILSTMYTPNPNNTDVQLIGGGTNTTYDYTIKPTSSGVGGNYSFAVEVTLINTAPTVYEIKNSPQTSSARLSVNNN